MPTKPAAAQKDPPMPKGDKLNPMVLDLSHHNGVSSFETVYYQGIRGIIHKATEGSSYVDPMYAPRRAAAKKAGLLWGAYHFFRPGDIVRQVEHFMRHAAPEPGTLMALDHEDPKCSAADAIQFLQLLEAKIGRRPVIYSGHVIKEQLGNQVNEYLGGCRLWLAQYGKMANVPNCWDDYWLWQFTESGDIKGVTGEVDVNSFKGTEEDLINQWVGGPIGMIGPGKNEWNSWGQATLNLLGTQPRLVVDGRKGPKTDAALAAFQKEYDLDLMNEFNEKTVSQLLKEVEEANGNR